MNSKTDRVRCIPLGAVYADGGHVFQGPVGGPVRPWEAMDAFRTLRTRTQIKATLHDMWHSFASRAPNSGVDLASVARILRHTTPSTTLGIYVHAMPGTEMLAVVKQHSDDLKNCTEGNG